MVHEHYVKGQKSMETSFDCSESGMASNHSMASDHSIWTLKKVPPVVERRRRQTTGGTFFAQQLVENMEDEMDEVRVYTFLLQSVYELIGASPNLSKVTVRPSESVTKCIRP